MAIKYSEKYNKNYESRVDQIILNSASYKTRNNILIQNDNMTINKPNLSDNYKKKSVSLMSYSS